VLKSKKRKNFLEDVQVKKLILGFAFLLVAIPCEARTITVDGPADFKTIQAAINDANDGDTVLVADGTYTGDGNRDINFWGKAITLRSENGPEKCIIDCQGSEAQPHQGFLFLHNGEDSNSVLDGFTITNGYHPVSGGGIVCSSVSPTIQNCIITNNRARDDGGGIMCSVASPTIRNCIITRNIAEVWWGGGMHCRSCTGAILDNCLITENSAREGGGISSSGDNFLPPGDVIVTNCTFSGNSAACGGAVYVNDGSQPFMVNCILWGDTAMYGPEIAIQGFWPSAFLHVSFSDVQGGESDVFGHTLYWEIGNIDAAPCFADPNNGDYHLQSEAGRWDPNSQTWVKDAVTSPCIDAGNPGCPVGDEPAPNGNRINMGAYGGTAEASKSPADWRSIADLTNDWAVDFNDLKVFVNYWLDTGQCIPGDLNRNQSVDFGDFAIFGQQWSGALAAEPSMTYQIEDCNQEASGLSASEQSSQTRFTATVKGNNIYFKDMMVANCCATELWLEMTVEGNLITICENEEGGFCFCICNYPVTATLGPFEPGTYILDVYEDYGGFIGTTVVTIGAAQ
jgi:hypothetical protein